MRINTLRRRAGVAVTALALSVTLAACGDDSDSGDDNSSSGDTSSETSEDTGASEDMGSDDMSEDAGSDPAAQTFGDACNQVPTDGAGSFDGMVQDPVATAASNNPLLSTLVAAVGAVEGLGDTLNGAEALTVFAPFNGAFEEIPPKDLNGLLKEAGQKGQDSTLYTILAHHVLGENADVTAVAGDKDTLAGDTLTIEGDENGMTVTDGTVTANVLCGNIPTANATVYVIDKVLTGVQ
ncbi:beta-Ig-H3/fasciclin [Nocardioides silvaticus]|uniref:Beta-Ig-H3/fasciclin n=1 Tax=Nocardioides silvaticus TaxID=2201891 RepID=A0A316THG4_9ACTN|nr:fasciclin domain-containing protein [Nocardioides silvaticus]PWN02669.1 beta-Ig-H3/fasciclin [Nocardioides silvaticus]